MYRKLTDLTDDDLFVIDAGTLAVTSVSGLGTSLFEVSVHPPSGRIYVPNTDARNFVIHHLTPECLSALHVYHPDPWPKKRHHKRRLVQPELVSLLCSRMAGGALLNLATDWEEYAAQMLEVLCGEPLLANTAEGYASRPEHRPQTKFETRGLRLVRRSAPATQPIHSSMFLRISSGTSRVLTTSETAKRPPGLRRSCTALRSSCRPRPDKKANGIPETMTSTPSARKLATRTALSTEESALLTACTWRSALIQPSPMRAARRRFTSPCPPMSTGFSLPGRPCMGSWTVYGLGAETQDLPSFVVMISPGAGGGTSTVANAKSSAATMSP